MSSMSSDASTTTTSEPTTAIQGSVPSSSSHSHPQSSTTESTVNVIDDTPHSYSEWRSRILANLDKQCNDVSFI